MQENNGDNSINPICTLKGIRAIAVSQQYKGNILLEFEFQFKEIKYYIELFATDAALELTIFS